LFFAIPLELGDALKGAVAFDLIGLLGVYKIFGFLLGHSAHLGGVASGYAAWWLRQPENKKRMRNNLPSEVVQFYDRMYRKFIG